MRKALAVACMVALAAAWTACGGGPEPGLPRPEHVRHPMARPPELPAPPKRPPKTLADVEKDFGLQPGSLKSEMDVDYQSGSGDTLIVTFSSHPRLSREVTVTPDGSVVLPLIGSVQVGGKTTDQIRNTILSVAKNAGVKNPIASVSVKEAAKRFVTFVGPGFTGGRIEIQGRGTILETLTASGWKPDRRAAHSVALIRNGRTSIINLDQILELNQIDLNIRLHDNDILIALNQSPFEIKGAVNVPGEYAVPPSGRIGLQDAIALASGLKAPAQMDAVRIIRRDGSAKTIDLNTYLFSEQRQEPIPIGAGDTIWIPPSPQTGVYVFGMVKTPGLMQIATPVTVSRAIAQAKPAQFGAVLSECKLVRGYPENPEVIAVDVEALMEGDTAQDIVMNQGDVLYVPESFGSDVLDSLGRVLGPVSGAVSPTVQIYTAAQISK